VTIRLTHRISDTPGHAVAESFDGFHNPVRLYLTLGYQAPATFEAACGT
jgi:hypothetical protein